MAKVTPEKPDNETLPETTTTETTAPELEGAAPEKRGRGRPKGSTTSASRLEELTTETPPAAATSTGAKRGRKPGSSKKAASDPEGLAKNLLGIHQLAAIMTGIPECQISPEEAKSLADAVCNVCEEYDLQVSGKTGAAIQLFGAAAMIYAPRVLHAANRIAQLKNGANQDATGQVPAN